MRRFLVAVLLVGVSTTACQSQQAAKAPNQPRSADPSATPAGPGATTTPGVTAGPPEQPPTGDVAKAQTVPAPKGYKGTTTLSVSAVRVHAKLALLTLTMAPSFTEGPTERGVSLYEVAGKNPVDVNLIDPVNLKRYKNVLDSSAYGVRVSADNNGSTTANYSFAAPPVGVDRVDVQIGDFAPLLDVPVTR